MVKTSVVWVVTFLLVGAVGVLSWLVSFASLPGWLIGPEAGHDLAHSYLFDFFGIPASMIVAGVAGFVVWRGFWLWGFAAALPVPVADAFLSYRQFKSGYLEPSELWLLISFSFVACLVFIMGCTLSSALGAGLRLAALRLMGRPASNAP